MTSNIHLAGKRILLVEDNPINQMLAKHTLYNTGVFLDICDTGDRAVDAVRRQTYDLILMDIRLPGMDGYEATTIMRKELKLDTPIVALTAGIVTDQDPCWQVGMDAAIEKPLTMEKLEIACRSAGAMIYSE